ncbi:MAG: response regulator [Pseudomonadota bacterium]
MKPILIVDDSPTMLASIEEILTRNKFAVEKSLSGEDARDKLKNGCKPQVIITDLNMPGMNGIELIQEIRKMPRYRFTPILMLTTESKDTLREEAKSAGATGWIVKPVDNDSLMQVLEQILP